VCDEKDMQLFKACTHIKLGDGQTAKFWTDNWMNGKAPKDMAPFLFKMSRGINILVHYAFANNRWLRRLHRLTTEEELQQFLDRWDHIQNFNILPQNMTASPGHLQPTAFIRLNLHI
jgi:hypothetical protein